MKARTPLVWALGLLLLTAASAPVAARTVRPPVKLPDKPKVDPNVFGGIGIVIRGSAQGITIHRVIERIDGKLTPAWDNGLKAGDRIAEVDGVLTQGLGLAQIAKLIRGEPGSLVTLTLNRRSWGAASRDFTLRRMAMKVPDKQRKVP